MTKKQEKKTLTIAYLGKEANHYVISCVDENGEAGMMRIPFAKYDEVSRSYVPSTEALQNANETLEKIGLTPDFTLADVGKTFEGYLMNDKASIEPIREIVIFSSIGNAEKKKLSKLAASGVFETIPLTEYQGNRFNFGINVDGALYRISQFVIDGGPDGKDTYVSVTYRNKTLKTMGENITEAEKSGALAPEQLATAKATYEKMLDGARAKCVKQLNSVPHMPDVEELLETGKTFYVEINVQSINSGGAAAAYLTATPVPGDEVDA